MHLLLVHLITNIFTVTGSSVAVLIGAISGGHRFDTCQVTTANGCLVIINDSETGDEQKTILKERKSEIQKYRNTERQNNRKTEKQKRRKVKRKMKKRT